MAPTETPETDPIAEFHAERAANPELIVIVSPTSIAGFGGGEMCSADVEACFDLSAAGESLIGTDENGREWLIEW